MEVFRPVKGYTTTAFSGVSAPCSPVPDLSYFRVVSRPSVVEVETPAKQNPWST